MRRTLRDTKDLISRGGGSDIVITRGGTHTRVEFNNPAGERMHVLIHKGSNPVRYEDMLRSQLRRKGLRP